MSSTVATTTSNSSKFDTALLKLVDICQKIAGLDNKPSPTRRHLNNYEDSFKHGPLEVHRDFVSELYLRYQHQILQKKTDFEWIETDSVTLIVGDGTNTPSKNIRIMISHFYRTALKIQLATERELESLPVSAFEGRQELLYPDILLLHLYRLFRCVCPDKDLSVIDYILSVIERNLGITKDAVPSTVTSPFAGLSAMTSGFMSSLGQSVPNAAQMPNATDMSNVFAGLFANPNTMKSLTDMFGKLGKAKNLNEAMGLMKTELEEGGTINKACAELEPVVAGILKTANGGKSECSDLLEELRNGPAGRLNPEDDPVDPLVEVSESVTGHPFPKPGTSTVGDYRVSESAVLASLDDTETPYKIQ